MEERVRSWLGLGLFAESHKHNHHHKSLVIGPNHVFPPQGVIIDDNMKWTSS
jgi:hypothetical protein